MNFYELEKSTGADNQNILNVLPIDKEVVEGYILVTGISCLAYRDKSGNGEKHRLVIKGIGAEGKQVEVVEFHESEEYMTSESYKERIDNICYIKGNWNYFNSKWNVKASKVVLTYDNEIVKRSDFYTGTENIPKYKEIFNYYTSFINNVKLKEIIDMLSNENYGNILETYKIMPAGLSMHDVGKGGLFKHTVKMLTMAHKLTSIYGGNFNIVATAVIFHDIGKCLEIDPEENKYSVIGLLKGHELIGYEKFMELANVAGLDEPTKLKVGHCIISHAGELEYGAITRPATMEAYIVNLCDHIDSHLTSFMENEMETQASYSRSLKRNVISNNVIDNLFSQDEMGGLNW